MTAKTDNFKNTQIPLWEDGDLANGANFSQLIMAIATLVNDTKADTLTEAAQAAGSGYTDTQAQAVVQAFLNSEAAKQTTSYTTLLNLINNKPNTADLTRELNLLRSEIPGTLTTEMTKIPAYSVKSYTFSGSTVTLQKTNNTTQTIAITAGASYLQATTEALLAECINAAGTKFLLTRADGAKILVDSSTNAAKPAAALIG